VYVLFIPYQGDFAELRVPAQFIPGFEISGVIDCIGDEVPAELFAVGDAVVGMNEETKLLSPHIDCMLTC
jgi:NADPH:quinone reductase-like Zn-dependent oxidoreductase